jgi:hypothetical protein
LTEKQPKPVTVHIRDTEENLEESSELRTDLKVNEILQDVTCETTVETGELKLTESFIAECVPLIEMDQLPRLRSLHEMDIKYFNRGGRQGGGLQDD